MQMDAGSFHPVLGALPALWVKAHSEMAAIARSLPLQACLLSRLQRLR